MSIDSINAAASAAYGATQANKPSTQGQSAQPTAHRGHEVIDTISISFEAKRFGEGDLTKEQRAFFDALDARMVEAKLRGEYEQEHSKFRKETHEQFTVIHDKLMKDSGGILYGTAYSPDDLDKPIKTTSGSIHPNADAIRSFLKEHITELDQMQALMKQKFQSFDEWKAAHA